MDLETRDSLKDGLLLCYICQSPAISDPVSMTCKSQHVFCFTCIFDYYSRCSNQGNLCCPNCRHGNGSFLVMSRLKRVCNLVLEGEEDETSSSNSGSSERTIQTSDEYYTFLPDLARRFPRRFRHSAESCVITTSQMLLFINNYNLLKLLRERSDNALPMWRDAAGDVIATRPESLRFRRSVRRSSSFNPRTLGVSFGDEPTVIIHGFEDTRSEGVQEGEEVEEEIEDEEVGNQEQNTQENQEEQQQQETEEISDEEVVAEALNFLRVVGEIGEIDLTEFASTPSPSSTPPPRRSERVRQQQIMSPPPQRSTSRYSLRPRHSNLRVLRRWIDEGMSICHLVVTLPVQLDDYIPRFRVSYSRSSAVTFLSSHLTSVRYGLILAVNMSGESASDSAIPICETNQYRSASYTTNGTLETRIDDASDVTNLFSLLTLRFSQHTLTRASIYSMICQIRMCYQRGQLPSILSRELDAIY